MRPLILTLAFVAALVFASPASAKEILSVQACGPDRCITSKDDQVLEALMNGGTPSKPPGAAASSYVLRASVGDGQSGEELGSFISAWVPRWRMLVFEDGAGMRVSPVARRAFERVTSGLATFPPSQLSRLAQTKIEPPTATPPPQQQPRPAPAAPRESGTGSSSWLLVPAGIAAALGGAALLLLLRRRRPHGGAATA